MTPDEFIKKNHRRLSIISVDSSSLRNQGAPGIIKSARDYFYNSISLDSYFEKLSNPDKFRHFLDNHTNQLLDLFPSTGKSWGAARKGLNLFLRDVVYNKFFSDHYGLPSDYKKFNETVKYLEVPLDSFVAIGIFNDAKGILPKWISIKKLTREISDLYQIEAQKIAEEEQTARVNLDLKYWRQE